MKKIIIVLLCFGIIVPISFAQTVHSRGQKTSYSGGKLVKIFGKFVSRQGGKITIEDDDGNKYTFTLSRRFKVPKLRKGDLIGLMLANGIVKAIIHRQ